MPNQSEFDFLVPYNKELLRPDEVAACLGRSIKHVYALIDEGKLEAHAPTDRQVERYKITRRSVLIVLAETAKYRSDDWFDRVLRLLAYLSPHQLSRLISAANQQRDKRLQSL